MTHLVAAGSAPGRLHLLAERNNQDAHSVVTGSWGAVAVVCDGCGSEPRSEVGAVLGASITAKAAARQLESTGALDLPALAKEVLSGVALTAQAAGLGLREHFLFTILGAAFFGDRVQVFGCGDGVWAVDGLARRMGPFAENAPPYLTYALWDGRVGLELLYDGPAASVLVGTDGACEGSLVPFWSEERVFLNPDLIRRKLKLQRLPDDATVAVISRGRP